MSILYSLSGKRQSPAELAAFGWDPDSHGALALVTPSTPVPQLLAVVDLDGEAERVSYEPALIALAARNLILKLTETFLPKATHVACAVERQWARPKTNVNTEGLKVSLYASICGGLGTLTEGHNGIEFDVSTPSPGTWQAHSIPKDVRGHGKRSSEIAAIRVITHSRLLISNLTDGITDAIGIAGWGLYDLQERLRTPV